MKNHHTLLQIRYLDHIKNLLILDASKENKPVQWGGSICEHVMKTRALPSMTSRTIRLNNISSCIQITIHTDFSDWLYVPRFFTLHPKFALGCAPKPSVSSHVGFFQRFLIDVSQHEDFFSLVILYYDRDYSIPFLEVYRLQ